MKFIRRYISTLFIVAMSMGVFHHHNDLKQHNDCQICTISHNLVDIDTPIEVSYLTTLTLKSDSITAKLADLHQKAVISTLQVRAPPLFS